MNESQPTARGLIQLFRAFEDDVLARLAQHGYTDVTPGHLNVLRHLDPGGLRVGQLARDAGLTKQAVSKTVEGLVARGYLKMETDPEDARARWVRYTARGRQLVAASVEEIAGVEARWQRELGAAGHAALRDGLRRLLRLYGI